MLKKFKNRFYPLFLSVVIISVSSIPLLVILIFVNFQFLNASPYVSWLVFLCSAIQGVGLAIMLNISTSLISDVIGNDDQSSAFVYGCYSFFDKFANGILLFLVTVSIWEVMSNSLSCWILILL